MDGERLDGKTVCGTAWRCPDGHVLGLVVVRKVRDGTGKGFRRVFRLLKLHEPLVDWPEDNTRVPADDVDCEIEGTVHGIKCKADGCGERRSWWQGEEALERLVGREVEA